MRQSVGFAPASDGGQVFYATANGEGVPVVFAYPHWYWPVEAMLKLPTDVSFFDAYSAGRPWYILDYRGRGHSSPPPGPQTLDLFLDDIRAVADIAGRPFELHARFEGCSLAVPFAARHPELVVRLVLHGPARIERDRQVDRMVMRLAEVNYKDALKLGLISMQDQWIDDDIADSVVELWEPNSRKARTGGYACEADTLDIAVVGRDVCAPVLLLEEPSKLPALTALAEAWPQARVAIHPHLKNGAALATEMRALIEQNLPPLAAAGGPRSVPSAGESLSERERELLGLLASGCTNDEIALRLSISRRTVERHIEHVYGKLAVHSRAQAAAAATRLGLAVEPDPE